MMAQSQAHPPIVLSIAGSDPSGGAGIQADLKTFYAFGVYGAAAITALTAQNTTGVQGVHGIPASFVYEQIASVASDLRVAAVKTGMLADEATVLAVCQALSDFKLSPIVADPVMVATSGDVLLEKTAIGAIKDALIPIAEIVTPNLPEAALLTEMPQAETEQEMIEQGEALLELGCKAALIKGGHSLTKTDATDILVTSAGWQRFRGAIIKTRNTHGTGCTLSSAIAAGLANGLELAEAVADAKSYVTQGLQAASTWQLGAGQGPLDYRATTRRP